MTPTPPGAHLSVRELDVVLDTDEGWVHAVDALHLSLQRGETFALVGESGCGKSMTALALMRLLPDNGRIVHGSVRLQGAPELLTLPESQMRRVRGGRIAMIFQEPATSLNPVLRVGRQLVEAIETHTPLRGAAARRHAIDWLRRVGIPEPERRIDDYPFRLSGGQKQRVMIAMALSTEPDVIVADEPTTALDVTLQQQILELLRQLQREQGVALLLITHDLAVVRGVAHTVALMYAGQIVEVAPVARFFAAPRHPYARLLLQALPGVGPREQALAAIAGTVPALNQPFTGCRFAPRCPQARPVCLSAPPALEVHAGADDRPQAADPHEHAGRGGRDGPVHASGPETSEGKGPLPGARAVRCVRWRELDAEGVRVSARQSTACAQAAGRAAAQALTHGAALAPAGAATDAKAEAEASAVARADGSGDTPPVAVRAAAGALPQTAPLLAVRDLSVAFPQRSGLLRRVSAFTEAVRTVSFDLARGRTLALVGESGCGKTTTGKAIAQLLRPVARLGGEARLDGQDLFSLHGGALRQARRRVQLIFQDPLASLDPRMRVQDLLEEGLQALRLELTASQRRARAALWLDRVGLPAQALTRWPHEFSGGQRQRLAIARALAVAPDLLICDEPTSALDVSVQAQILNLLRELQAETGVAYLFISHNLGVVEYLAHDVAVMQAGRIVETGPVDRVLGAPAHPCTRALLAAVPRL